MQTCNWRMREDPGLILVEHQIWLYQIVCVTRQCVVINYIERCEWVKVKQDVTFHQLQGWSCHISDDWRTTDILQKYSLKMWRKQVFLLRLDSYVYFINESCFINTMFVADCISNPLSNNLMSKESDDLTYESVYTTLNSLPFLEKYCKRTFNFLENFLISCVVKGRLGLVDNPETNPREIRSKSSHESPGAKDVIHWWKTRSHILFSLRSKPSCYIHGYPSWIAQPVRLRLGLGIELWYFQYWNVSLALSIEAVKYWELALNV